LTSNSSLSIDVGNTSVKLGVFQSNLLVHFEKVAELNQSILQQLFKTFAIKNSIIINSGKYDEPLIDAFLSENSGLIKFDHNTPIPIKNKYATPETLGRDRLCGAIGGAAQSNFRHNALVIDTGTCITFNMVQNGNEYIGGSIAPGIAMRFKALPEFTAALPLVDYDYSSCELIGDDTNEAIKSGILNGVIAEVDGLIDQYCNKFQELFVYITGGGCHFFEKQLKNKIFAVPQLVLFGLNNIIEFNAAS